MDSSTSPSPPPTRTFSLTDKQVLLRNAAASPSTHVLAYGGARSGKTFGFCYCVGNRALMAPNSRHLVARLHNIDVRQAVMMDTWPKMMRLAFPGVPYTENKQDQFVTLPNGSEIWFGGLDDKERVDKILGKEFATIYINEASQVSYESVLTVLTRLAQACEKVDGRELALKAYYDLNPVGRGHWTYKQFVEKVRPENGVPVSDPDDYSHVVLNPTDNPYLPAATLAIYANLPARQRQRFYSGEYLSELPGALWSLDGIDKLRRVHPGANFLTRIVVAIDPSGSDGTGGDCQGILVVGLGADGHGYVLADRSCRKSPAEWARVAIQAYHQFGADVIVAETNYGGAMVENTIKAVDATVNFKAVTASRGKHVRAEPVAAFYETIIDPEGHVTREGIVHHVKPAIDDPLALSEFAELEEQLGMFTTAGYQGSGSPDRADALVWAITELMLEDSAQGYLDYMRDAVAEQGAKIAPPGTPVTMLTKAEAVPDVVLKTRLLAPPNVSSLDLSNGRSYAVDAERCVSVLVDDVDMLLRAGCARV